MPRLETSASDSIKESFRKQYFEYFSFGSRWVIVKTPALLYVILHYSESGDLIEKPFGELQREFADPEDLEFAIAQQEESRLAIALPLCDPIGSFYAITREGTRS